MFLVILLYSLFGFTFTLGKIALYLGSPLYIVGIRMLVGGLCLAAFVYLSQFRQYRPQLKDWQPFAQVTLFGVILPYCLRAWGLQYVSSTKAAFLFSLMPIFTAFFSYMFTKERLSYQQSTGLLLGFLGMMPTLFTTSLQEELTGTVAFFSLPEVAILFAVASFGYNFLALKNLVAHHKCPPPVANMVSMLTGGLIVMPLAVAVEPVWVFQSPLFLHAVLLCQLVISNFICANLQASLLNHYSPTFMSFAGFLTPLCASLFGWILLHEAFHYQYLVSLAMVVAGLTLFSTAPKEPTAS